MEDFIQVSQQLGRNILYVQGAGGNTSVKIGNKLYVKASGEKLKNITEKHGYVCCRYKQLASYFFNKKKYTQQDEHNFLQLIDASIIESESFGAPSMEIGFHAVIPSKYVFHLHSVYTNVFACMKYGSHRIKDIFSDIPFLIVDYINPGYELAHFLSNRKSLPALIFLKNHGIIVHGDDIISCLGTIELLHIRIESYLKQRHAFIPFKTSVNTLKIHDYIFPDSAVFSHVNLKKIQAKKKKEVFEIMSAQQYSVEMMKRLGGTPSYLTKPEINKLLAMKQEKYRQELFKK